MLKDIVPQELINMLGKSVSRGYILANIVSKSHAFLDTPVGRETKPYIRRAAIEFLAYSNAKEITNLESQFRPNKTRNYHHVELYFNKQLIITINHLGSINGVKQEAPRPAEFRKALASKNPMQDQLFPNIPEKYSIEDKIHSTLIHEGRDFPERVALIVQNPNTNKILDTLPIRVSQNINNSDVNMIEGLTPEFIEYVKKASGSTK